MRGGMTTAPPVSGEKGKGEEALAASCANPMLHKLVGVVKGAAHTNDENNS